MPLGPGEDLDRHGHAPERERFGGLGHAADARDPAGHPGAEVGLRTGGDADGAVARADRRRPVRRAVHEQAVAERHPAEAKLWLGPTLRGHPSTLGASSAKNRAASPRSATGTRSSALCMSAAVWNMSISRRGQKPYATQPGNASRNQRESVKPGSMTGTIAASATSARTNSSIRSISGDSIGDVLPTTLSVNRTS